MLGSDALRRVQAACEALEAARLEMTAAVLAAVEQRETYRAIAEVAGLSYQRIAQIVKESREG